MPLLYKILIAVVFVLPGGVLLAPALALWLRRSPRQPEPVPAD